jgi:hypothetical protein
MRKIGFDFWLPRTLQSGGARQKSDVCSQLKDVEGHKMFFVRVNRFWCVWTRVLVFGQSGDRPMGCLTWCVDKTMRQ